MKHKTNLLDEIGKIFKEEGDINIKLFGVTKKASIWIGHLKDFKLNTKEASNGKSAKRKTGKSRIQIVTGSKSRTSYGKTE